MVHSTACKGVKVHPRFTEGWNKPNIKKCAHALIDAEPEGSGIYQTLPWNMCGWHAGGSANSTHIGFEIAEPKEYSDVEYTEIVIDKAIWLCVFLCKQFKLTEKDIICHSEGHAKGIASNHADVMHWWPKAGWDMDRFRDAVQARLNASTAPITPSKPKPIIPPLQRTMKLKSPWMRGNDVKQLQQRLMVHKFTCKADGVFGPVTKEKVKQFQRAKKLATDGIVGPKTWAALWN